MTNEERPEDLIPTMVTPPLALQLWPSLTQESRIKAEWFSDESIPNIEDKIFVVNPYGYWFNC